MAISLLTSGTDTATTDTSFTTASVSPSASNVTWLGFMVGALPPTGAPTPSGARGTWTLISTVSSTFFRAYLYAGTGSASAGTITVTRQGTDTWDGSAWVVADDDDVLSSGPTIQTATGTSAGTTATATLSAFQSGNHALSISFTENATASTAQASWTQLANPTIGGLLSFAMAYRLSDAVTTVDGTFTPGGSNTRVLGAEVEKAAAVGPTITDQPDNDTAIVTPSEPATFTTAATTNGSSTAAQWYLGASGTTTTPINTGGVYSVSTTGTTSLSSTLTITPTNTSLNANTYWCRVTDSAGTSDSTAATLTVLAGDTLTQPVGTTNSSGNPATSSGSLVSNAPGLTRLVATVGGVALDQVIVITKR